MANINAPFGFRPVGTLGQASYTGKLEAFTVVAGNSTAIGIGDPVALAASSANADGLPTAARGASGSPVVGVCVGVQALPSDLSITYRKASTAMVIYVDVDPGTLYEIQEDAVGGAVPAASIGLNASFVLGTVDTATGNGKTLLDSSTAATTNTLDCHILRASSDVKNELGVAYQKFIVKLNNYQYINQMTGIS
jgi:hypothetical protein